MQWNAWSPTVRGPFGEERNCCRECNPSYCHAGPTAPSRQNPAPMVPSHERARMGPLFVTQAHGSIDSLQRKVPNRFWDLTLAHWSAAAAHPDMSRLRKFVECSCSKSYRKILSHYGAVRVDGVFRNLVEDNLVAWLDPCGTAYMDVGNDIYTRMFERTWPGAIMSLGLSNHETIGDCIEAILGFAWLHRRAKRPLPNIANEVIREIERACFALWVLEEIGRDAGGVRN